MAPSVLVVEDHDETRRLFALILDEAGFTVDLAMDGEQALLLARERRPSVIMLDLTLPRCSGPEVLAALKREADTAPIPVIVVATMMEEVTAAVRLMAAGVLPKPCSIQTLVDTVSAAARARAA